MIGSDDRLNDSEIFISSCNCDRQEKIKLKTMSSKRLLDALELLKASKSVATKHLAVRQRQLDVYTKTSSLTKGVKGQVDGLVLTAQAATALAKRFNDEPGPRASEQATSSLKAESTKTTDTIQRDAAKASPPPPPPPLQSLEKPHVVEQHKKPDNRAEFRADTSIEQRATPISEISEGIRREPLTLEKKADTEAGKGNGGLVAPEVSK